jgi:hypothetical protein
MKTTATNRRTQLGWLLCALLTGCTVGPKYHPPAIQAPPAYKEAPSPASPSATTSQSQDNGNWTAAQPADEKIRGDWWAIFNEPELNDLEGQLNINNQTIKTYFENFMEARALVGEARAQYFPTISIGPSYSRQRSSSNLGATSATANPGKTSQIYSLPLDVSWTPDLFGRIRNEVRNAQYNAQVSAADLENERLTEQADLAEYFFEIRGQDALIKLYSQTVAEYQKSLDLTQAQYDTGVGDQISVVEARNTLQSAQASLTNLGILRAQYEHAIAVLIGKAASDFSLSARPLLTAPPPFPIGVPSLLLQRRPDVAAAERIRELFVQAHRRLAQPLLVSRSELLAAYLQCRAQRGAPSIRRHLQRRCIHLPPNRADGVPASRGLSRRDPDTLAADPAAARGRRLGANCLEPGEGQVRHWHRSIHRCGYAAEHGLQQRADPHQFANQPDDRRDRTGTGLRRRLGYITASHSGAGDGQAQQGGY